MQEASHRPMWSMSTRWVCNSDRDLEASSDWCCWTGWLVEQIWCSRSFITKFRGNLDCGRAVASVHRSRSSVAGTRRHGGIGRSLMDAAPCRTSYRDILHLDFESGNFPVNMVGSVRIFYRNGSPCKIFPIQRNVFQLSSAISAIFHGQNHHQRYLHRPIKYH